MNFSISAKPHPDVEVIVELQAVPAKPEMKKHGTSVGDVTVRGPDRAGKPDGALVATVSLGPLKEATAETVRRTGGAAAKWINGQSAKRAAVKLAGLTAMKMPNAPAAFVEGLALGAFNFDRHKTKEESKAIDTGVEIVPARATAGVRKTIEEALKVAEAANLAREWAHEPPNVINPVTLAERVRKLAASLKLKCNVFDEKQLKAMKANALLGVGMGSKTPSRLIVLEHTGHAKAKKAKPVVLIGKAITFDTGGYSLKDKTNIVGMKYDKCGGMAVLGTMRAVAALKLRCPVVGIIAAAENMISGEAYRPNDIITTMSGKTVEIISTDAEGRMVLADALTYACKNYKPRALINLATLTGGIVVALGNFRAGIMSTSDRLADALIASGERVHERLWRMPLDNDYFELIKGDDSDMKNAAGRTAHPIIGGIFLKQFVDEKVPWAHLDIAGMGDTDKDQPYCPKGATGFGVRLLVDYIKRLR
ncbi:MAG: leucyl aminopeptidase [Phycisphaerales bacterium]|nr:MAG: leucyl aminopeptidase [Phycisphaerales bacterium]